MAHPENLVHETTLDPTGHESFSSPVESSVKDHVENIIKGSLLSREEMQEAVMKKIDTLPPLSETVTEIQSLLTKNETNINDLLKIIEKDTVVVSNILRVANSALYGFSGRVSNIKQALNLLGFKITSATVISIAIHDSIKSDLSPYGVDMERFTLQSSLQSRVIEKWKDPEVGSMKDKLLLAAFLQEVGKIIISMIIVDKKIVKEFQGAIKEWDDISIAEKATIGMSSSEVTALIFSHWKLNPEMIEFIKNSDTPEMATEQHRLGSEILRVAKVIAPVSESGMNEASKERGLHIAESFGFDATMLEKSLDSWSI